MREACDIDISSSFFPPERPHSPLLLENLNEDQVELVDIALLLPQRRLVSTRLDNDSDDKVPNTAPLDRKSVV